MVSRNSETRPIYRKVLPWFKFGHHLLQNSSFDQWQCDPNAIATVGTCSGSIVLKACLAPSAIHTGSHPQYQNSNPSAAISSLGRGSSSRMGAAGSPCYSWETHMLPDPDERVHCCHEASNCLCTTIEATFAGCLPSDTSKHSTRTCHWWSGW